MDIEFHYHVVGLLAAQAGFDPGEAALIAHASQLVDDNGRILTVTNAQGETVYANYISQTMNILQPKRTLMRIYPIFHFLPGDPQTATARRADGKMHVLNTTPDSALARQVLEDALGSPAELRPYRIGIALHAYADTWAHQNFVGWHDGFNGQLLNPLPNIGHADHGHHPDWVGHRWRDGRLTVPEVDNNARFLEAAERIFERLCRACGRGTDGWRELERELRGAFGPALEGEDHGGREVRLGRYRDLAPWLPEYREHAWRDEALEVDVRGLPDAFLPEWTLLPDRCSWKVPAPERTHWWRFQEAVKAHQAFGMACLQPLFAQMGVDLHQH